MWLYNELTASVKGGSGHVDICRFIHCAVSLSMGKRQSKDAYDGTVFAYGQRTSLREPMPVSGHSISPLRSSDVKTAAQ